MAENSPDITDTPAPNAPSGKRVLLVDDHADTVNSLAMLLRLWNYDVQTALEPSTALALAGEFRPQIVMLDIGLPGMSGYELASRIRDLELRDVVLIAMTGFGEDAARARSIESGFDHHLLKPVGVEQLKSFLATL